jgi:hypothetical protein
MMGRKRRAQRESRSIDFAGAEKKLRQAEFFLHHLVQASAEMKAGHPTEPLEFYFSACLTAAQSVFYVMDGTGKAIFTSTEKNWRNSLPERERSEYWRMIRLRDDDVHLATTDAESIPKYVTDDASRFAMPQYQFLAHNAALFGERPFIEEVNPDGTKVRGHILRSAIGLYMNRRDGSRIEAASACRQFIDQLRSLLDAVKAAS